MVAPSSQKADVRPIGFYLTDSTGETTALNLSIRPEELTRSEPARQTVTQTLGSAWLDDFGRGVQTITIRGHTGWRGGPYADGAQLFAQLRDTIWTRWHQARADAVSAGKTPDSVSLIFADALDNITAIVAPGQFTLKRNRQRPLLMMYELPMTVLSEALSDPVSDPLSLTPTTAAAGGDILDAGVSSLNGSVAELSSANLGFLPPSLAGPASSLIQTSLSAFNATVAAVTGSGGLLTADAVSLVSISQALALAGRNGFYAFGAQDGLSLDALIAASQLASAFDNAFCVLTNAIVGVPQYPDYSQLYGASNCSSTVGGSPISPLLGVNAFEALFPVGSGPVSVSPDAQANLTVMANADPVLAPMTPDDLTARFTSIADGVVIA